jgi:excisionase family DNA binding protein
MTRALQTLNIREAAAFLNAHEQTVRGLARRRAIPCFKVGRDWRFRKDALLRWTGTQQGRIQELKCEINHLFAAAGQPPRFASATDPESTSAPSKDGRP